MTRTKTVGIQGIRGAFHEEAAGLWFNEEIEIVSFIRFSDLIESIESKEIDYAIMAIENTISGTIHQNLRLLIDHDVHICGEVIIRIQQHLGALPGTTIEQLTEVRSHYMALNQCKKYFQQYPNIDLVREEDTALAAKLVSTEQMKGVGAIASKSAMAIYNLEIISPSIETNKKNYTRFVLVQAGQQKQTQAGNKLTMHMVLSHNAGSLHKVLSVLAAYNMNLTKIESIPIIGQPYHYQFIMDMEVNGKNISDMTGELENYCEEFDIIGRYQADKIPGDEIV